MILTYNTYLDSKPPKYGPKLPALSSKIAVIAPGDSKVSVLKAGWKHYVKKGSIQSIMSMEHVKKLKEGNLILFSTESPYGSSLKFMILPKGKMIMEVGKDLYEQLGVKGRPIKERVETFFRIVVSFNEDDFEKPSGSLKKLLWATENVLKGEVECVLMQEAISSDLSLDESYYPISSVLLDSVMEKILVPQLQDFVNVDLDRNSVMELLEWIGLASIKAQWIQLVYRF
ncbi:hypothetical protein HDU67_006195 [Dinochytrium kinnereticum]|nr:hypothetical protein HDU67_006195 [Dinochytrium kinnereticum]